MSIPRINLLDIPAEGREFSFTDLEIWSGPASALNLEAKPESMSAVLTVIPQEGGCLLRGRIRGTIAIGCDRCLEETRFEIDREFDLLEEASDTESFEESLLTETKQGLELDVAALLWEQFALALPVHPLCDEGCRGICPECGKNLNEAECSCGKEQFDPRMAALRGLKVSDKKH